MRSLRRLVREQSGQDLAEYGIAIAVIVIGVVLLAISIGDNVESLWSNAEPALETVINAEP